MNTMQCYECSKFMSYKQAYYQFTFFGRYEDVDPPDPLFMHKECYDKKTDGQKKSFEAICWQKPYLVEAELEEEK